MIYDLDSLDYAIDYILPKIAEAKKRGVDFNRPSLLNIVAREFLVSGDYEDRRDCNKHLCYAVVRQALEDLRDKGYMVPGNRSIQEDLFQ